MKKPKTTNIISGDSRIDRPRGVRSARRRWASATADAPGDRPGSVRPQAARIGTVRRAPDEPGESSTRTNANMPTPCSRTPVTASAASGPAAGSRSPRAAAEWRWYRAPSDTTRTRAGRRPDPQRRGQALDGRRRSVGPRPLPPFARQQARQNADDRDDEDEDQRQELPAPPVADDQVEQARDQRRDADDHGHEQQRRRPARRAPRPDAPPAASPSGTKPTSGEHQHDPEIAERRGRLRDVERAPRNRQQEQPHRVRAIGRRQQQRADDAQDRDGEQDESDEREEASRAIRRAPARTRRPRRAPTARSPTAPSGRAAMIGPSFSMATEKRSSVSRAPVSSSELISIRQRSHANARRVLNISDPVERHRRSRVAADQADEQLFERLAADAPGAQLRRWCPAPPSCPWRSRRCASRAARRFRGCATSGRSCRRAPRTTAADP